MNIKSVNGDISFLRLQVAVQKIQQGRFSGSAACDDPDQTAGLLIKCKRFDPIGAVTVGILDTIGIKYKLRFCGILNEYS